MENSRIATALLPRSSFQPGLAGMVTLVLLIVLCGVGKVPADEVKTITGIKEWQHPVKGVLQRHRVKILKVELLNQTYPVFYVKFPYDPWLAHNDNYFKPLYYETLKANGFWNYALVDPTYRARINIKWNKKTQTLSEHLENVK